MNRTKKIFISIAFWLIWVETVILFLDVVLNVESKLHRILAIMVVLLISDFGGAWLWKLYYGWVFNRSPKTYKAMVFIGYKDHVYDERCADCRGSW